MSYIGVANPREVENQSTSMDDDSLDNRFAKLLKTLHLTFHKIRPHLLCPIFYPICRLLYLYPIVKDDIRPSQICISSPKLHTVFTKNY